ncbi:MAG: hypothetical protein ACE5I9_03230 [Candidatus Methylomirabilales bacterium]
MATIVEYSPKKKPINVYPRRIISPPRPRSCCSARMVQVGGIQEGERGRPFYYRRCQVCGFTLRHFLPVMPPDPLPLIQRRERPSREVEQAGPLPSPTLGEGNPVR